MIRSELVADLTLRPNVGVIRFLEKTIENLDKQRLKLNFNIYQKHYQKGMIK